MKSYPIDIDTIPKKKKTYMVISNWTWHDNKKKGRKKKNKIKHIPEIKFTIELSVELSGSSKETITY